MPAKPGVSKVRAVAPGSASGRGGAAGAALSRSESPSWGADRLDHRMATIRTHVRSRCPPGARRVAQDGRMARGPNRSTGQRLIPESVAVRRELLADVFHVELLDLLDQVFQRRL